MSSLVSISDFSTPLSFLLLVFLIYIFGSQISKFKSSTLSYTISAITHLRWAWDFLFCHSLFGHRIDELPAICEELRVVQHKLKYNNEVVECAVCLCKIEEGEDIRELRCEHLFHRICLDRWTSKKRVTCPLCRQSLAPPAPPIFELGMRVLEFKKFTYTTTSDERERWWLR